jgi:DNA-binding response OmpR family regulator
MLFDEVGSDWRDFLEQLRSGVHVLIVDDEPVVCDLMCAILAETGYQVDVVHTADDAWEKVQVGGFDLLIADKNLPGESGVELLGRIRDEALDLPSMMITGYPSVESVSDALCAGASDYISKPFDDVAHVRNRIVSIVERRLQGRLYGRIVKDLASVVTADGAERDVVDAIGRELFSFKKDLAERPDVLVVAPSVEEGHAVSSSLESAGLTVLVAKDRDEALQAIESPWGPLAAIVSFDVDRPVALVAEMRLEDPLLAVLVASTEPLIEHALAAVQAGASDFFMRSVESLDALEARTYRALETSQKSRLYLHLIAILHRVARRRGHPVADTLFEVLPVAHREYLADVEGVASTSLPEVDVDLSSLFDDIVVSVQRPDRRVDARTAAGRVIVTYRPASSDVQPARTRLRDISRSGMFIPMTSPLPRGTVLDILVTAEAVEAPLKVRGTVVRTVKHDPDPDGLSGCGVLVGAQWRRALADLVDGLADEAPEQP